MQRVGNKGGGATREPLGYANFLMDQILGPVCGRTTARRRNRVLGSLIMLGHNCVLSSKGTSRSYIILCLPANDGSISSKGFDCRAVGHLCPRGMEEETGLMYVGTIEERYSKMTCWCHAKMSYCRDVYLWTLRFLPTDGGGEATNLFFSKVNTKIKCFASSHKPLSVGWIFTMQKESWQLKSRYTLLALTIIDNVTWIEKGKFIWHVGP